MRNLVRPARRGSRSGAKQNLSEALVCYRCDRLQRVIPNLEILGFRPGAHQLNEAFAIKYYILKLEGQLYDFFGFSKTLLS